MMFVCMCPFPGFSQARYTRERPHPCLKDSGADAASELRIDSHKSGWCLDAYTPLFWQVPTYQCMLQRNGGQRHEGSNVTDYRWQHIPHSKIGYRSSAPTAAQESIRCKLAGIPTSASNRLNKLPPGRCMVSMHGKRVPA